MQISTTQIINTCCMKQTDNKTGRVTLPHFEDFNGSEFGGAREELAKLGYRRVPSGYITEEKYRKVRHGVTIEVFLGA